MAKNTQGLRAPASDGLSAFRSRIRGEVILPHHAEYEQARRVWNGMIDRRPAIIVRAGGVSDVVQCVGFARDSGLPLAVRGGGHSVSGFSTCDDGLVIDLSGMKRIEIDAVSRTAYVEGGVLIGELDRETSRHGLVVPAGQISTTGIAGLTLGGGLGWLQNKYGLTIDSLLTAEVVCADGVVRTATDKDASDLFWALRGGGGNFGVVTSFVFRLHPLDEVVGGVVVHDASKATEVLDFYKRFTARSSPDVTVMVIMWRATLDAWIPSVLQGRHLIGLAVCHAGRLKEARAELESLRSFGKPLLDLIRPMPYLELQRMLDDTNRPGTPNYWKSGYIQELSPASIETVVGHAYEMPSPLSKVLITNMKGAVREVPSDATAFANRDAPHYLEILAKWQDNQADTHVAWARRTFSAMQPFSTGGVYSNFLGDEGADRVRSAYGEHFSRLVDVKTKYDPANLFRLNHNIPPRSRADAASSVGTRS